MITLEEERAPKRKAGRPKGAESVKNRICLVYYKYKKQYDLVMPEDSQMAKMKSWKPIRKDVDEKYQRRKRAFVQWKYIAPDNGFKWMTEFNEKLQDNGVDNAIIITKIVPPDQLGKGLENETGELDEQLPADANVEEEQDNG